MFDQGCDIIRQEFEAKGTFDIGGMPMSLQLNTDDAPGCGKLRHNLSHRLYGHEAARKQHQRLPAPVYLIVEV
jgi:hypothetical protein